MASPTPIHSKLSGGSTMASMIRLAPVRAVRREAKCTARAHSGVSSITTMNFGRCPAS
jgi:hypothetical protein